jgi:hypothetical protein
MLTALRVHVCDWELATGIWPIRSSSAGANPNNLGAIGKVRVKLTAMQFDRLTTAPHERQRKSRSRYIIAGLAHALTLLYWSRGAGYDRNVLEPEEVFRHIDNIHGNPVRR